MVIKLCRIAIFPIKSLDGCEVTEATVLAGGALEHDRRFALVDADGQFINGKRCAAVHRVRAAYSNDFQTVTFACDGEKATFVLADDQEAIGCWLGQQLSMPCQLVENCDGGFPDDTDAPGPTLVGTASLQTVADWWDGLTLAQTRLRFRANLEVGPAPPFWEDQLVTDASEQCHFRVGQVVWQGKTVSQRCAVPTRDPHTGEVIASFARRFADRREQSLPSWAPRFVFDHFYRLAINTQLVSRQKGNVLRVGDLVGIHAVDIER